MANEIPANVHEFNDSSTDFLTERDDNEGYGHSQQFKELPSSTPNQTKRALSFSEYEERQSKKFCASPNPKNVRLNRSLASADRNRYNLHHSNKVHKMESVERRLAFIKVKNPKRVSSCVKAAINKGFIKIVGAASLDLHQEIISGPLKCGHNCTATLNDVLFQPDFVGIDASALPTLATVFCSHYKRGYYCSEGWAFVTGMCTGKPRFDWTGQSVNHCKKCDGIFGKCADDYKSIHCPICGEHYSSKCCYNCFPDSEESDSDGSPSSSDTLEL